LNLIIVIIIQNGNGGGNCAAENCGVMKFLISDGVPTTEIRRQLSKVIEETINSPGRSKCMRISGKAEVRS
jgi:hypothetical protein